MIRMSSLTLLTRVGGEMQGLSFVHRFRRRIDLNDLGTFAACVFHQHSPSAPRPPRLIMCV